MGVGVDEAGAHHEPRAVDDPGGWLGDLADGTDTAVADADVANETGTTGSIDDGRAVDAYIENSVVQHLCPLADAPERHDSYDEEPPASKFPPSP